MGRIKDLFDKKQKNILNVYYTAGYPALNDTLTILRSLQNNGADMVEIGMPYSDPLADGAVIQQSSRKALSNGMDIQTLFSQLKGFREDVHLPVILMGYLNPLLQYGFEKFCRHAAKAGVDGLIIPDLPLWEYENEYMEVVKQNELDFIFLVTPETSEERIRKIDKLSTGFIYAVSSSSITGSAKDFSEVDKYLEKLKTMKLTNPVLAGFGISDHESFNTVCQIANGAIIGSAFISFLNAGVNINDQTTKFMKQFF